MTIDRVLPIWGRSFYVFLQFSPQSLADTEKK